jgi:NAD(P)-dependent dehydrogenase (short-subunit alcohol dehydrogenase family)
MDEMTAVVTGGSRGIGAAVCRLFGAEGAHVVTCARDADALDAVAGAVRSAGGSITTEVADVREASDVEALMTNAAETGGHIDVVVANAGIYRGEPGETPLARESYEAFDEHVATNARGVYATVREAVPHLADDARVLVSSGGVARDPDPGFGSYAVSKAAAEALARGFAAELEQAVGVVDPGQVTTDLTDEAPGRDPEDIAPMFRWAAVDAPAEDLDGGVLGLREWRMATR